MSEDATEEILHVLERRLGDFALARDSLESRLHVMSLDFPQPFRLAEYLQIVRPHLRISPVCGRALLLIRILV